MRADLVITGGTIVDGSGKPAFAGDLAIAGDRIIAVGSLSGVDTSAARTIDAAGCHVTPGFVDIHTHYDGQAIWSDRMKPSSVNGVTTAVMGNCGVGFAPCRPEDHATLISLMEGVEDIPGAVMAEGLDWSWETFQQYLDALDARRRDIDVAAYIPHSPLRVYVMGQRGVEREPSTEEDRAQMRKLVAEGVRAGALGCATSRMEYHRTAAGDHIPTHFAAHEELDAIAQGLHDGGGGIMQMIPNLVGPDPLAEIALVADLARRNKVSATFTGATPAGPRALADMIEEWRAEGLELSAQVYPRPIGMIVGLGLSWNPFSFCESFQPLVPLSREERVARMRDPELRAKLIAEQPDFSRFPLAYQARMFDRMFPIGPVPNYEPAPDQSIAARAKEAGVDPLSYIYDALLEDDGRAMFMVAMSGLTDGTLDDVHELIESPATVLGLGDGGAHYGLICDASYPTTVLSHWVRDRDGSRVSIEKAVHELARRPAEVVGLHDRGLLAPGYKADVNVIDLARVRHHAPEVVFDLPAGGRRLLQRAEGYRSTIVSGVEVYRDGEPTGELPGRLVRGRQAEPARTPQHA